MMKLSEAIRLGAMLTRQQFHGFYDGDSACALHAAALALGRNPMAWDKLTCDYPWLGTTYILCPERGFPCLGVGTHLVLNLIWDLNDNHRWTRERIADYVSTIEPQDPAPSPEPVPEQQEVAHGVV